MSDITMCSGKECERKEYCHRYTAPVNKYRQSYFVVPPLTKEGCTYFWRNEKDELLKMEQ